MLLIVLALSSMLLEEDSTLHRTTGLTRADALVTEIVVLACFSLEALLRMYAMGLLRYLFNSMCALDLAVLLVDAAVILMLSGQGGGIDQAKGAKVLRGLRVLRFVRVLKLRKVYLRNKELNRREAAGETMVHRELLQVSGCRSPAAGVLPGHAVARAARSLPSTNAHAHTAAASGASLAPVHSVHCRHSSRLNLERWH